MIKGFKKSNIYVDGQGIINTSLKVENGKIASFSSEEDFISLPDNLIVVPGFIDKHIHGANDSDSMDPTLDDIRNIAITVASEGVSAFMPTTMTQSFEAIEAALNNIKEFKNTQEVGSEVIGIHLEGPFISKKMKGAQPEQYIIPCDVDTFKRFNEISGNNIKEVTLAYEENGAELIKYLVSNNIVASLGHTNATTLDVIEAAKLGASSMTHTFNGMKAFHHRETGTVGGGLLSKEINCELICDLIHVCPEALKVLYMCKGKEGISLITDAMEAKHLPDGKYMLGGQDVYVKDGAARLIDGTLAGSTLHMNQAIRNIKAVLDLSLTDAIDMATINPAKNLHIEDCKGSIAIGKDADFAIIDKDLNVYMTINKGRIIYEAGK